MSSQEVAVTGEISETHTHFLDLRDTFYERIRPQRDQSYGGMRLPYPIVLEAHLLELADDKMVLREELEELIRKKIIRSFEFEIPEYLPERFFVLTIDYLDQLAKMESPIVDKFSKEIVSTTVSSRVTKEALTKASFSDDEIRELVNMKCLLLKSPGVYLMSMPFCGGMRASLAAGRKYLVKYLASKARKTHDRGEVERRTIDDSIFYAEFHVHELIGLGVFEVIKTPSRADRIHLVYNPYKK